MSDKTHLLPCPFCGGTDIDLPDVNKTSRYPEAHCWRCGTRGPRVAGGDHGIAWNARQPQPAEQLQALAGNLLQAVERVYPRTRSGDTQAFVELGNARDELRSLIDRLAPDPLLLRGLLTDNEQARG